MDEGIDNEVELDWFATVARNRGAFGNQVCNYDSRNGGKRASQPTFLSKVCDYGSFIVTSDTSSKVNVFMGAWEDDYVGEYNTVDDNCDPVTLTWDYKEADENKLASFECSPGAGSDMNFNLTLETVVD